MQPRIHGLRVSAPSGLEDAASAHDSGIAMNHFATSSCSTSREFRSCVAAYLLPRLALFPACPGDCPGISLAMMCPTQRDQ